MAVARMAVPAVAPVVLAAAQAVPVVALAAAPANK